MCVCVCAVLAKFLINFSYSHFPLLCYCNITNVHGCTMGACTCSVPLQNQSAPSCCFHSSSENQYSQPHSLPCFALLVCWLALTLFLLFLFLFFWCFLGVLALLKTLRWHFHSDGVDQSTKNIRQQKRKAKIRPIVLHIRLYP